MLNVLNVIRKLKGKDRIETLENYSIAGILLGSILLAVGIGLTVLSPRGFPAILSMSGALCAFCATVALVLTWLLKEFFGKEDYDKADETE